MQRSTTVRSLYTGIKTDNLRTGGQEDEIDSVEGPSWPELALLMVASESITGHWRVAEPVANGRNIHARPRVVRQASGADWRDGRSRGMPP